MSHDDAFAAFQARKREAERAAVKVTWRRVSPDTGGGYSGLGPNRQLVYCVMQPLHGRTDWEYGRVVEGKREAAGTASLLLEAKMKAAALLGAKTDA